MAQLRHDFEKFVASGTQVVIVGPEGTDTFRRYFEVNELPFIGLPDPKSRVLKLYGQEFNLFKLGRMPATVLVDAHGVVRFVHYGRSMSDIPKNGEILTLIQGL